MRKDGFELNDVIGEKIGRLPTDGQLLQGLDCDDDRFNKLWGTEPECLETTESQL